uniref:Matrix protein n=1 Tax=avian paramyxovirus 4 TaxID=28274 RepID=K9N1E6_9MONO|nr:matrix protein [Avian paramyxovirus 4]
MADMDTVYINLMADDPTHQKELLSFPLIPVTGPDGKKELQHQVRTQSLLASDKQTERFIFLNTYGFIYDTTPDKTTFSTPEHINQPKRTMVSAAMMTIGLVPANIPLNELTATVFGLKVRVRKSARYREVVWYQCNPVPALLAATRFGRQGGLESSTGVSVKASEKIDCEKDYTYYPYFLSVCYIATPNLFKVPKMVANATNSQLYHLTMQVTFAFPKNIPPANQKLLTQVDEGFEGTVDCHFGNMLKKDRKGNMRTLSQAADKVRRMNILVGIFDLHGPTLFLEYTGKLTKALLGFMSTSRTAIIPISQLNPMLSQLMWSSDAQIVKLRVVITTSKRGPCGGEQEYVLDPKFTVKKEKARLNPFKKAAQ